MIPDKVPADPAVLRRAVDNVLSRPVIVMRVIVSDFNPVISEIDKVKVRGRDMARIRSQLP